MSESHAIETETDRKWRARRYSTRASNIPAQPGIYALGLEKSFEGLESMREIVYIGQSTNLQKRFREHSVVNEKKPRLRRFLKKHQVKAKFWYTTQVDVSTLNVLERKLIVEFDPEFNNEF